MKHLRIITLAALVVLLGISFVGCGYYHTVKKGETVYSISQRYGVDQDKLMKQNKISDPRRLQVGQKLKIARFESSVNSSNKSNGSKTASNNNGSNSSHGNSTTTHNSSTRIASTPPPVVKQPDMRFIWPAKGAVVRPFGKSNDGRINDGIDIGAPEGAKVVAAADGEVILATTEGYPALGNLVVIKHKRDYVTLYAHNKNLLVSPGVRVKEGQPIATVGSTGRVQTPTLHFEIRIVSTPLDPMKYLPPL